MKFQIIKTVHLNFLGQGWENCTIQLSAISVRESQELSKMGVSQDSSLEEQQNATQTMIELLEKKFISGTGWNGKEVVVLEATDLVDLPPQVMAACLKELTSGLTPNA